MVTVFAIAVRMGVERWQRNRLCGVRGDDYCDLADDVE